VHDFFQFISHVVEAVRVASALHPPLLAIPNPTPPPPSEAHPALSRNASWDRLVRQHSQKLAQAEDALNSHAGTHKAGSGDWKGLSTPRGIGEGLLLKRRMSRTMPKLPEPCAAVEKERRKRAGERTEPDLAAQNKDGEGGARGRRNLERFGDPGPSASHWHVPDKFPFNERARGLGPRVVRWEEEEVDRGVDLTPQPVRTTSFPMDAEDLPKGEHEGVHGRENGHGRRDWDEQKTRAEEESDGEGELEQRTLQVRIRVTCVRLTVAIARETFSSLVVQDVMVSSK
jgi:hypothetical protein